MSEISTEVDLCQECMRSLGGDFYDSKQHVFCECTLCHRDALTQHFKLIFVDELPPKKHEEKR